MAPAELVFLMNLAFVGGAYFSGALPRPLIAVLLLVVFALAGRFLGPERIRVRMPSVRVLLGMALVAAFGVLAYQFAILHRADVRLPHAGEPFTAKIIRDPRPRGEAFAVEARALPPFAGDFTIIMPRTIDPRPDDMLRLTGGTIKRTPGEAPTLVFPKSEYAGREAQPSWQRTISAVRRSILAALTRYLPSDSGALMSGLTLGATEGFSADFREALRRSGTTHIVAVSGYNIGVIAFAAVSVFGLLFSRRLAFFFTLFAILLFTIMTGAESSVVRAGIMGAVALIANHVGRPYGMRYAIVFAATIMLIHDPTLIREDVGFLLSFASLLGITLVTPRLYEYWFRSAPPGVLGWRENLTTTIGAQLAVFPIILGRFGMISLASVGANMMILPAIPVTMALGGIVALTAPLAPLSFLMSQVAELFLRYEIITIRAWALIPQLPIPFLSSIGGGALYYAAIGWLIATSRKPAPHP